MSLIDTNVLIYSTFQGFPEHELARARMREIVEGEVTHFLTWVNVFEYLRTATHRGMLRPAPLSLEAALENVAEIFTHPVISRLDEGPRHLQVFEEVCLEAGPVAGNFVHHCRIAAIMRENGVSRILTRDTMFRRIPGIEVVDPFD